MLGLSSMAHSSNGLSKMSVILDEKLVKFSRFTARGLRNLKRLSPLFFAFSKWSFFLEEKKLLFWKSTFSEDKTKFSLPVLSLHDTFLSGAFKRKQSLSAIFFFETPKSFTKLSCTSVSFRTLHPQKRLSFIWGTRSLLSCITKCKKFGEEDLLRNWAYGCVYLTLYVVPSTLEPSKHPKWIAGFYINSSPTLCPHTFL